MVGTAVYQVGFDSSIAAKNFSALNPGVQNTEPPRDSGASSPAISPWMWNSGMMSAIGRREGEAGGAVLRRFRDIDLRQRHDFRPRRGARGVQDQRHILRPGAAGTRRRPSSRARQRKRAGAARAL